MRGSNRSRVGQESIPYPCSKGSDPQTGNKAHEREVGETEEDWTWSKESSVNPGHEDLGKETP